MAKGPWNRFESAREFGETCKGSKREPIELFDVAKSSQELSARGERYPKAISSMQTRY